jgi:FeS assembly SUF system protein
MERDPDVPVISEEELESRIVDALKTIYDPEIPVNIYDLGLIYEIKVFPDRSAFVLMTLTAPGCPVAGSLPQEVENRVRDVPDITDARVQLTFDPPYTMDMMSEEARLDLGFM